MVVVLYSDYNGSFSYKLLALTSVFRLSSVHSIVTKKTNEILKYLEAHQYVYIVTPCFFTRNKENKTTFISSFLLTDWTGQHCKIDLFSADGCKM